MVLAWERTGHKCDECELWSSVPLQVRNSSELPAFVNSLDVDVQPLAFYRFSRCARVNACACWYASAITRAAALGPADAIRACSRIALCQSCRNGSCGRALSHAASGLKRAGATIQARHPGQGASPIPGRGLPELCAR